MYQGKGCPPVESSLTGAGWKGGKITLAANVSSQYVSSILISAPYAKQTVELTLDGRDEGVCSRPYIDITIDLLTKFGIEVKEPTPNVFQVTNKPFRNPNKWLVEGDASSASYPLVVSNSIYSAYVNVNQNMNTQVLNVCGDLMIYDPIFLFRVDRL